MNDIKFTKDYTLNAKGIAIIIMCIHHLFYTNIILTVFTKVCVAIFTILSGYGINESYKRQLNDNKKFVLRHIKKLMINYWYIFIPMVLLSLICYVIPKGPINVYGTGINGVVNFLLDFLGISAFINSPSLNNTWWYMEAILFCYILFPLIRKGIRTKPILTFIILLIPNIIAIYNENIHVTTDREIYYILPFALGIFLSEKGIFNKLVNFTIKNKYKYVIILLPIMMLSIVLANKIKLIGNIFYAISVISISVWVTTNFKLISKVLKVLGKHSMNIFLSHSFFYYYLIPGRILMNICRIPIIKLIVLVLVSLLFSVFIENIKSVVNRYRIKESINNDVEMQHDDSKEKLREKSNIC